MSTIESATVDTLTATVHTIKVDGRKLTKAIVRQLDGYLPEQIEPMGRVNLAGRPGGGMDHVTLIGRHKETGALVTAVVLDPARSAYFDTPMTDSERTKLAAQYRAALDYPLIVL